MPSFSDKTVIEFTGSSAGHGTDPTLIELGFTPKQFAVDQDGYTYLAKSPDPLSIKDVFRGYIPDAALAEPDPARSAHVKSLEIEITLMEVIMAKIIDNLFQGTIAVPKTYLHLDHNGVSIISKLLPNFDEFLAKKVCIMGGKVAEEPVLPSRTALDLSPQEADVVGQLYAVALITNHWDILNSKMLNSGWIKQDDNNYTPAIVDLGFCAHLSYRGRNTDSLPFDDEEFMSNAPVLYNISGPLYQAEYRHRHALPFDVKVGPMLVHSLIEDLYEMSGTDKVSLAIRDGFQKALNTASEAIRRDPLLLIKAFKQALAHISIESAPLQPMLDCILSSSFYKPIPSSHNLFSIIKGRIFDCQRLLQSFQEGATIPEEHERARACYRSNVISL